MFYCRSSTTCMPGMCMHKQTHNMHTMQRLLPLFWLPDHTGHACCCTAAGQHKSHKVAAALHTCCMTRHGMKSLHAIIVRCCTCHCHPLCIQWTKSTPKAGINSCLVSIHSPLPAAGTLFDIVVPQVHSCMALPVHRSTSMAQHRHFAQTAPQIDNLMNNYYMHPMHNMALASIRKCYPCCTVHSNEIW
jgi:hypothetical protein